MVYFNISESDSHKIIRDWLRLYVYAELPVSDAIIDGLTNNLVISLKRGLIVNKDSAYGRNDSTSL
jgi:hypothetical protein